MEAKGARVQLTRWGSWHHAMKQFDKRWHSRLALMCVAALRLGWVSSVSDLPLFGAGGFEEFNSQALCKSLATKKSQVAKVSGSG